MLPVLGSGGFGVLSPRIYLKSLIPKLKINYLQSFRRYYSFYSITLSTSSKVLIPSTIFEKASCLSVVMP